MPTICGAALSARRIALAALRRWRSEGRFADPIISEFLAKAKVTQSDRTFALELSYGAFAAKFVRATSGRPQLHLTRLMES